MPRIENKQWNRICRGCFKKTGSDHSQVSEKRSQQDGIESRLAHPIDHILKSDGREQFDAKLFKLVGIREVRMLQLHRIRPVRRRVPAVADQPDTPKL